MKYRALAESLIPVAEATRRYFMDGEGAKRFRAEEAIAPSSSYRPTLLADGHDGSLLAIEVNEGVYTDALDGLVLECVSQGIPIRLFVASPGGGPAMSAMQLVRKARMRGIGVLEVVGRDVQRILPALSLSLFGLQAIGAKGYPKRYRARLTQAEDTFRNGDPVKGCSRVYDLIEECSRDVAIEIDRLGLWRVAATRPIRQVRWFRKHPWANVLEYVDEWADFRVVGLSRIHITKPLWSRIRGLTPHRNESGHEPATSEERRQRDRELKTRFEHAVDTFADLVKACPTVAK